MTDREFPLPSDEQAARDRELIEAVESHESVGERYARTGEVPVTEHREPSMGPSANAALLRDPTPVKPLPTPPRRVGRRILQAGLVLLLIAVGYSLVSFWQVWSTGRSDEARAVDAIVVMGAAQYDGRPSPQLAARLDHAVDLWNDGLAPVVIVTGGNQEGDRFTEASTSAAYLVERGDSVVGDRAGGCWFDHPRLTRSGEGVGRRVRPDHSGRHRSVPRAALEAHGRGGRIHGLRVAGTELRRRRWN